MKKKILLVTLHFDDSHEPVRRRNKLPQGMGAVFLAGAFAEKFCEIKVYSELFSGPLEDEKILGWPDMVVLTGVTNCFDRMLHITAYVKTKNPGVIVVAGGPPVRALPLYSSRFFDYSCTGDIEQLQDIVMEAFGKNYVAEEMVPRLDLAYWIGMHGHVETSRNCNFRCNFCSLTGEKRQLQRYNLDYIRRQLEVMGKRRSVHFIDNNFYGNDRQFFLERLELIEEFRQRGQFTYWSAIITSDFFQNDENLILAKKTGCVALFSGVESFDQQSLGNYNKLQNMGVSQIEMISKTLDLGIAFWYGLILDVYTRNITDMVDEIEAIIHNDKISLPGFITIPIPLLGTPYFIESMAGNRFLPNTTLRHMDGKTICMQPLENIYEVANFIENLKSLKGYRTKVLKHAFSFARRYRHRFNFEQMVYALASNGLITLNALFTAGKLSRGSRQTHISSTERVESTYMPKFRVEAQFENYFSPTMLTGEQGEINEDLGADFEGYSPKRNVDSQAVICEEETCLNG